VLPTRTATEMQVSFNQYDPFGDTESCIRACTSGNPSIVSTNTIRSGILKGTWAERATEADTGVSTNTIRSGILKVEPVLSQRVAGRSFNQYDPFGDTERGSKSTPAACL